LDIASEYAEAEQRNPDLFRSASYRIDSISLNSGLEPTPQASCPDIKEWLAGILSQLRQGQTLEQTATIIAKALPTYGA
jgi:hypothetical protein